ncbi:MAG: putative ABC exporter domain-containing protein [Pseudomonadota bacterium]
MLSPSQQGSVLPVLRALIYLRGMMLRNLLLSYLRRLRQPRYLLGSAVALAYIWFAFIQRAERSDRGGFMPIPADAMEMVLACLLIGLILAIWLRPDAKPGLGFTEAETAFLFPAPFSRRQLIHYKLLSGLGASFLAALFLTLLMARTLDGWSDVVTRVATWWALNANVMLHTVAVALVLNRFSGYGVSLVVRRSVITLLCVLYVGGLVYLVTHEQFDLLRQLLTPFRALVRPFVAGGAEYAGSLSLLFVVFALQYFWVLRLETPFEEASIALAARHAELVAKMRGGKAFALQKPKARREPFRLRNWMPVEFVLLWKRLLALPAWLNGRTFVALFAIIVIGMQWLQQAGFDKAAGVIAVIALAIAAYLQFLVSMIVRFDLAQVDQMKAWPVPGWRIVLGTFLSPMVIMTGIAWLLILAAALGMPVETERLPWLTSPLKLALAVSFALLSPAITALQLIGPNAIGLFFPGFAQTSRPGQRGFDVAGMRMVLMAGQLLLLMLMLIPPLLVAGLGFFFSRWFTDFTGGMVTASACACVVLLLEALYGVHLLGERFERLDVAGELRQ